MKGIPLVAVVLFLLSCQKTEPLPFFGRHDVSPSGDTIHHVVPDFDFVNQDSQAVNKNTFKDKIYVVDYFFTSCPTICPKVRAQTLRVDKKFEGVEDLAFLSVSIDTRRDSVPTLKKYKTKLEINNPNWHFVTGNKMDIYEKANGFFHVAVEDPEAPGGFDHDGYLVLIDKESHIRAYCNGTKAEEVDVFMTKIQQLLDEYKPES